MVRSVDFAATKVLLDPARVREADTAAALPWARQWATWVSASFLGSYFAATSGVPILAEGTKSPELFDVFLLERALYQLKYQLEDHSDSSMVTVPLMAIANMVQRGLPTVPRT